MSDLVLKKTKQLKIEGLPLRTSKVEKAETKVLHKASEFLPVLCPSPGASSCPTPTPILLHTPHVLGIPQPEVPLPQPPRGCWSLPTLLVVVPGTVY